MAARRKQTGRVKADVAGEVRRLDRRTALDDRQDGEVTRVAQHLVNSPIMRRVPFAVRTKLERLVFERISNRETTQAIAQELQLERYGIGIADLRRYREALDELIRPVASAQVIAGVLGCLPAKYRRRMMAGNQVLLLSKVAMALSESKNEKLEAGELLKLASVLRAAAQSQQRSSRDSTAGSRRKGKPGPDVLDPEKVTRAVRTLYGLTWPPPMRKGA